MRIPAATSFLLAASVLTAATSQAAVPEYDTIKAARPDGRHVTVKSLTLVRDAYKIELRSGAVHFLAPLGDETFAAVFIGDGSYRLTPSTYSELRQLQLVKNDPKLEVVDDRFDRMLLFFTDKTAQEIISNGTLETGPPNRDAVRFYEDFLAHPEQDRRLNVQLRVLLDLLNRPSRSNGVFAARVDGRSHGRVILVVDPLGISNFSRQFDDLSGEEVALLSTERGAIWYLSAFQKDASNGRGKPHQLLADASHYEIDTTLDGTALRAHCTITLTPAAPGLRVLPILIAPVLDIRAVGVVTADGIRPLPLIRDETTPNDVAVVFPQALDQGKPVRLRFDYEGRNVISGTDGRYAVGARTSWYPNLGTFVDLATYELTFRFPKRYALVSVGEQASERVEGDQKVAVWRSPIPIRVAGFNYGEFVKLDGKDAETGLAVSVYTNPEGASYAKIALADAINATRVANLYFGKPPYSHLSMTQQVQMNFGQSWPTLVFLPGFSFTNSTQRVMGTNTDAAGTASLEEFVNVVGWHEVSHQWWGHQVGWESYRDQWMSEGFAEFTASLMLEFAEGRASYDKFWGLRRRQIVNDGRFMPPYQAGAITQGQRLATERSADATQALLYGKGGYILHMLRMQMRDERRGADADRVFKTMMQDFVTTWSGKNPSTLDFQRTVEKHMLPVMDLAHNGKLDYFFDQWVRGSEVPRVTSSLQVSDLGSGRYKISGTVTQAAVSANFLTAIPIYLDFGDLGIQKLAHVTITGPATQNINLEIALPQRPRRVLVNAREDVLIR